MALEGPLWRTMGALSFTPGRLTFDYFAGRPNRYIAPLRLYLTFSVVLLSACRAAVVIWLTALAIGSLALGR